MRTLEFVVDKQTLTKHGDFNGLVVGSKGYLQAWFKFTGDWAGYRKVAVFTCASGEYPVLLQGGPCTIPDEVTACATFKVRVVGRKDKYDLTTGRVTVIQRRH